MKISNFRIQLRVMYFGVFITMPVLADPTIIENIKNQTSQQAEQEFQNQLVTQINENQHLRTQLAQQQAQLVQVQNKINALQSEKIRIETDLSAAKRQQAQLRQDKHVAQQITDLEDQLQRLKRQLQIVKDENHQLQQNTQSVVTEATHQEPRKLMAKEDPEAIKLNEQANQLYEKADWAMAFSNYQKAAELGYAPAQTSLGEMYLNGRGVTQNNQEAAKWFRKAAEQGYPSAQANLGVLYTLGQGLPQSYQESQFWLYKAAEQGVALAQVNLAYLYEKGLGAPQSDDEAVVWLRRAAEQGFAKAQLYLGWMYLAGKGVPQNSQQGAYWYHKAAEQGEKEAIARIATMAAAKTPNRESGSVSSSATLLPFEPETVVVPEGDFLMGFAESEPQFNEQHAEPQHLVHIRSFRMSKTEVTFAQFDAYTRATGKIDYDDNNWGRGNQPVMFIDFNSAQEYAQWLSQKTGKRYRLPTAAEWEYAARAGTTTPFYTGNCINTQIANYNGAGSDYNGCGANTGISLGKPQPVASYPANPWGLYDMAGNVMEWTCSEFSEGEYSATENTCNNGTKNIQRIIRGGSYSDNPSALRSAVSAREKSLNTFYMLGFRLAMDI